MKKVILLIIIILSILGIVLSSYLTYIHIKFRQSPEYKSGCSWFSKGEEDPCKTVDASKYSEIFGIPLALYGVFYFLFLFLNAVIYLLNRSRKILNILLSVSGFGVLFYIYLTYLEVFVIHYICPLCVITSILNLGIFLGVLLEVFLPVQKRCCEK